MARYAQIAKALHTRIHHGDYRVREFPPLSELASELGVNPRTVGKAVNELLGDGILQRLSTGRITVNDGSKLQGGHLALLAPAYPSLGVLLAHDNILRVAQQRGWQAKLVNYAHWEDPTIALSLRGFDATFLIPSSEAIPPDVLALIKNSPHPVVVLDQDTSASGIPCLQFANSMAIPSLLNVLSNAGHRRVACFNSQPVDPVIKERIAHWALWKRMQGVNGQLIDDLSPRGSVVERAYKCMSNVLRRKELDATAIFCTTGTAALGVMRALTDHELEPGLDIAVCAADDEAGSAPYFRPSLTCVRDPAWDPYLEVCLDWFAIGGGEWVGPLLVHPAQMPVYVGESTGPVMAGQADGRNMRDEDSHRPTAVDIGQA